MAHPRVQPGAEQIDQQHHDPLPEPRCATDDRLIAGSAPGDTAVERAMRPDRRRDAQAGPRAVARRRRWGPPTVIVADPA